MVRKRWCYLTFKTIRRSRHDDDDYRRETYKTYKIDLGGRRGEGDTEATGQLSSMWIAPRYHRGAGLSIARDKVL